MFYEIANFCEKSPFLTSAQIFYKRWQMWKRSQIFRKITNVCEIMQVTQICEKNVSFLGGMHYYNNFFYNFTKQFFLPSYIFFNSHVSCGSVKSKIIKLNI